MNPLFFIARRFAFRERTGSRPAFIVLASVVGIAVGTAALILTLSIVKGFAVSIENKLISFTSHIQVRQAGDRYFQQSRFERRSITATPGVMSVSPFLEKSFILRSRRSAEDKRGAAVRPVVLKGITGQERAEFLKQYLFSGEAASEPAEEGVLSLYIGKTLAEYLGLKSGDRVLLAGLNGNESDAMISGNAEIVELLSSLDLERGRIKGIYDTGLQEGFDDVVVLGSIDEVQKRFHPGMISGYDIRVDDIGRIASVSGDLGRKLGFPFYTYTVFERYANLFEWLKLQKNISPLLIITITVVAVFNIISTLLVLVIEKTREIGMLIALGLEPRRISRIFLGQSLLIALAGVITGAVTALGLTLFEQRFHLISLPEKSYFITSVPLMIDPLDYLAVGFAVVLLTMLFAFIPSRIAASLNPGTALTT
ncbi:MAG: ABC transporter permease [Chlorobi bacterium]|nr:ABC transporter permease [Chlorobiota bacterium]